MAKLYGNGYLQNESIIPIVINPIRWYPASTKYSLILLSSKRYDTATEPESTTIIDNMLIHIPDITELQLTNVIKKAINNAEEKVDINAINTNKDLSEYSPGLIKFNFSHADIYFAGEYQIIPMKK